MAAFTITEVKIDRVDVRVGDQISFTWLEGKRMSGIVATVVPAPDGAIDIYLQDAGADPDPYGHPFGPIPIRQISSITRQPREGEDVERDAIQNEDFPTVWDRVLGADEAP